MTAKSRLVRLSLLILGVIALGVNLWLVQVKRSQALFTSTPSATPKQPLIIPEEGLAVSPDTNGTIPGNPNHTIADMKRLYKEIKIYQQRHNGSYPEFKEGNLHDDRLRYYKEYGYSSWIDAAKAFRNPDMKYSDKAHNAPQPEDYYPYVENNLRPDGSTVGSPKPANTKDVLAYSDIYYHQNLRLFKGDATTVKPAGFYLVLWDDGQVEKVAYQDVHFAAPHPTGNGGLSQRLCFPGQAGSPPQGTLSHAEYDKWIHDHI